MRKHGHQYRRQPLTPEAAGELGAMDMFRYSTGAGDTVLTKLLKEIDEEFGATIARLESDQRIALVNFCHDIAAHVNGKTQMDRISLLLYGFQMGHDYALEHGRLLRDKTR